MNKKLLLSLAVVSTLGLTGLAGCNSSSTGPTKDTTPTVSVDPISDIEIVKPTLNHRDFPFVPTIFR